MLLIRKICCPKYHLHDTGRKRQGNPCAQQRRQRVVVLVYQAFSHFVPKMRFTNTKKTPLPELSNGNGHHTTQSERCIRRGKKSDAGQTCQSACAPLSLTMWASHKTFALFVLFALHCTASWAATPPAGDQNALTTVAGTYSALVNTASPAWNSTDASTACDALWQGVVCDVNGNVVILYAYRASFIASELFCFCPVPADPNGLAV